MRAAALAVAALAWSCRGPAPGLAPCPERPIEETRRLYDFTPAGGANPVVAAVDGCWIQIPLGELRGHLAAELSEGERGRLTPEGRRRQLERLIDEHLILEDAYRQQADRTARAAALLEQTRKMLLGEYLTAREVDAVSTNPEEQAQLRRQLLDRAFARAPIGVSNEGWAALREAVKAGAADRVPEGLRDRPLAAFADTKVTVGDAAAVYFDLPPTARPRLDEREGVAALLRHLLEYELLAAEAVAQGIDRTRPFREKVELNRSAIVRMWWRDRLMRRAAEREPAADPDRREELRAEEARALRQGHQVVIDEEALARY
ncbi:MAG TPA: hypothetical protein VF310_09540 [Vicinamibacteria bacterium]